MTKTHHDDDDDDDDLTGACGWHLLPGNCSLKGLQSPSSGCQQFVVIFFIVYFQFQKSEWKNACNVKMRIRSGVGNGEFDDNYKYDNEISY